MRRLPPVGTLFLGFMFLAAASVAFAAEPEAVEDFFNGKDLAGWSDEEADMHYWSVVDGAIVGQSDKQVPHNTFLWSAVPVGDFYLSCEVRLTPNSGNAGIQFRSRRADDGHAVGYQADVGETWWGKLYHEHGRGMLFDGDAGLKAVKPGEWNRYEILAVGDRIWTAVNGQLSVAVRDPRGEREGLISLQIHSGPPTKVEYGKLKLVKHPQVELAGLDEAALNAALQPPKDAQPNE